MKEIKVRLKPTDAQAFDAAKRAAERALGVTMTNNEFAGRVIRNAIKEQSK